MKKLLAVLFAAVLTVGAIGCSKQENSDSSAATTAQEAQTMTGQEVLDAMASDEGQAGDIVLVDVRKADEYAAGHIEGAVNITLEDIQADVSQLDSYKDKQVILYCNSGNRSGQAATILLENGFTNVYNADGVKEFEYNLVTE